MMSSVSHKEEEERLRQKLKRKAEERKTVNSTNSNTHEKSGNDFEIDSVMERRKHRDDALSWKEAKVPEYYSEKNANAGLNGRGESHRHHESEKSIKKDTTTTGEQQSRKKCRETVTDEGKLQHDNETGTNKDHTSHISNLRKNKYNEGRRIENERTASHYEQRSRIDRQHDYPTYPGGATGSGRDAPGPYYSSNDNRRFGGNIGTRDFPASGSDPQYYYRVGGGGRVPFPDRGEMIQGGGGGPFYRGEPDAYARQRAERERCFGDEWSYAESMPPRRGGYPMSGGIRGVDYYHHPQRHEESNYFRNEYDGYGRFNPATRNSLFPVASGERVREKVERATKEEFSTRRPSSLPDQHRNRRSPYRDEDPDSRSSTDSNHSRSRRSRSPSSSETSSLRIGHSAESNDSDDDSDKNSSSSSSSHSFDNKNRTNHSNDAAESKGMERKNEVRSRDNERNSKMINIEDHKSSSHEEYSSVSESSKKRTSRTRANKTTSAVSLASSDAAENEDGKNSMYMHDDSAHKDKRTIFVSQLVQRVNERDLRDFFTSNCGCKIMDVILLRDKRTGRHKGCAYVELGRLEDVPRAMECSGKPPNFQRFPILVKAPELGSLNSDTSIFHVSGADSMKEEVVDALADAALNALQTSIVTPLSAGIKQADMLNVYIGNIDRNITQAQLYAIFSQFGDLDKISLQVDPATGISKGFAFFGFRDINVANLCIHVMSGQVLAGRPLRSGWANLKNSTPGGEIVSKEFPLDSLQRIKNVDQVLVQLNGTGLASIQGFETALRNSSLETVSEQNMNFGGDITSAAEVAINAALGINTTTPCSNNNCIKPISLHESSSTETLSKICRSILVHNMFDKDLEVDEGWEEDIKLEFTQECEKYGKLERVRVMSEEVGGKIYARFETIDGAIVCAKNLNGRWFDKRQLMVEFIADDVFPV